ncbi:cubilin [Aplysia californica]|uniref:Cubilin n=1 Tax=Aplysia californica TaxID=6500 RepID=A0ABM0ZZQ1_APLCA|nr:cubilin [Aplysia californica]
MMLLKTAVFLTGVLMSTSSAQDPCNVPCNETIYLGGGQVSRSVTFCPGRVQCNWMFFTGSDDQAVRLTNMTFDFMAKYRCIAHLDDSVSFSPVLANGHVLTACNMTSDQVVVSRQNQMLLSVNIGEFKARNETLNLTFTAETTLITGCGGTLLNITVPSSGEFQNLTSPNYPNPYPPDSKCGYILISEDASKIIEINILDLDIPRLDPSLTCNKFGVYDDRLFLQYPSIYGSKSFSLCNNSKEHKANYPTTAKEATIEFYSGSELQGKGFMLQYRAVDWPKRNSGNDSSFFDRNKIAILLGLMGGLALLVVLIVAVKCMLRKRTPSPV